ncbi:MAG: helix-turn-helix domain-containing protein [Paenibacillaceae bacterium]|nr:helix-turn-helix domain-containing protein [Paenibacillaceae bacterium]
MKAVASLSYRQKLMAFSLVLSIVPVLVLGLISSYLFASSLQKEVDSRQYSDLKHMQTQFDTYVARMDQTSLALASNALVQRAVESGISMNTLDISLPFLDEMKNTVNSTDLPIDVTVILNKFDSVYSQQTGIMRQIDYQFTEIAKLVWSGVNTSYKIPPGTYMKQADLLIVRPVPLNATTPQGLLVVSLKTNRFVELMEQSGSQLSQSLLVFDDTGRLVVSANTGDETPDTTAAIQGALGKSGPLPTELAVGGKKYLITSVRSTANGWQYVAATSASDIAAEANRIRYISWMIAGAIALIWGAAAIVGSNRLFVPLQRLVAGIAGRDAGGGKPSGDVIHTLDHAMRELKQTNEHLMLRLNEQMPIVKEHALLNLLRGELLASEAVMLEQETRLGPLGAKWFYVGVAEIDQWLDLRTSYNESDRSLIMYALRKMIEEIGEADFPVLGVSPKQGQIVFLVAAGERSNKVDDQVSQFARQIGAQISRYFPFTVSVAIAEAREGFERVHLSFEEAQSRLMLRLALGPNTLIEPGVAAAASTASFKRLIQLERTIVAAIAQGRFGDAADHLRQLTREASASMHSFEAIIGLFAYLIGDIDASLQEIGVDLGDMLGTEVLKPLYGVRNTSQLLAWIDDTVIGSLQKRLELAQTSKKKASVQAAVTAVQDELETDLSLQLIAERLQIPRPTLSKWFKEETGDNFGDYLIRLRMDKAKEWLRYTEMPIKTIAERLRYTSVTNFTRIFKQSTGDTPGAYRAMDGAESEQEDNRSAASTRKTEP